MLEFDKVWWEKFRHDEVVSILEMTGRKNSDYTGGSENSNPFANFDESLEFGVDPLTGICVRMADKSLQDELRIDKAKDELWEQISELEEE